MSDAEEDLEIAIAERDALKAEVADLRARLAKAEETIAGCDDVYRAARRACAEAVRERDKLRERVAELESRCGHHVPLLCKPAKCAKCGKVME